MQQTLGILGQLVHIDDVCDGSQFPNGIQSPRTFQSIFQADQKENRGTDKHDPTDGRFQELDEVDQVVEEMFGAMHAFDADDQEGHDGADQGANSQA